MVDGGEERWKGNVWIFAEEHERDREVPCKMIGYVQSAHSATCQRIEYFITFGLKIITNFDKQ